MDVDNFVSVNINLRTGVLPMPTLDVELLLLDSEAVPIYDRVRVITQSDVSDLTENSVERNFATVYFGQDIVPPRLILGRQAKTAIPPAFVCPDHDATIASWAAITGSGSFTVVDSLANSDVVGSLDFTGVTTFAQVLAVLNAALAAIAVPNITGLDSATFGLDVNGNVVLTMPSGQDDTDPTISITYNATPGTVPYLLGLTESGAGTSVSGNAIETLLTAYDAVKTKTKAFYNTAIEGRNSSTYTEETALAAQIETERRQCTFVDSNSDAVDGADFTDLQSVLSALSYENATVIYTEHNTEYPDAAADGNFLPAEPGTKQYGHSPLSGVHGSGSLGAEYDLSSTHVAALEAKGCNYVVTAGGYTFIHKGKNTNGNSKRLVKGKHWLEAGIQSDIFAMDMNWDLMAFDELTLGGIENILKFWLTLAGPRPMGNGLINSFEINMPTLEEFTAADKAAGDMTFDEVFIAEGNFEAYTFRITGSITI